MTAEALTARVLDHRGRVRLERRWTLDELRGDGDGGYCEPYRGAATSLDVAAGFSAVLLILMGAVLGPLALIVLVLRRISRPAPPLAKMVRTLSSLEKGKRVPASKEARLLAEYRLGPLQ